MRSLICLAHVLMGLAVTMQGCVRHDPGRRPDRTGPQVGQLAPETVGEDLDGVPFKLSDYRGKVVLLDFWGDW